MNQYIEDINIDISQKNALDTTNITNCALLVIYRTNMVIAGPYAINKYAFLLMKKRKRKRKNI